MRDGPPVSIVVPAHNHARYLPEALESLLGQDYPHLEVVVIDDGSTDETGSVLDRYRGRLRWERQANAGQSTALNRGWALARGEILSYLSADDVLLPGAVGSAVEVLARGPGLVMTYCDFQLIDTASRPIRTVRTQEYTFEHMLARFITVAGPGIFFRRSGLERAGGWDPAFRQNPDVDFLFRLGLAGAFQRIPRVLAAYRVHEASQTRQVPDAARAEEPIAIAEKFFSRRDLPATVERCRPAAFASAHLLAARQHLRAHRWAAALQHVSAVLHLHPSTFTTIRAARLLAGAFRR